MARGYSPTIRRIELGILLRRFRLERQLTASQVALATDIIVGHPGESDAAFENTMDVVREVGFSKLHVFRYSVRPGTAAAEMHACMAAYVGPLRASLQPRALSFQHLRQRERLEQKVWAGQEKVRVFWRAGWKLNELPE